MTPPLPTRVHDRATTPRVGVGFAADLAKHGGQPALIAGTQALTYDDLPDLVAQARAGLLTAHASRGDAVPVRAGGIPMADLTAGFLLATGVLAALVHSRETGTGELVDVSLLAAALAVQLQDLVWLSGETDAATVLLADRAHLDARAGEIAAGVAIDDLLAFIQKMEGLLHDAVSISEL